MVLVRPKLSGDNGAELVGVRGSVCGDHSSHSEEAVMKGKRRSIPDCGGGVRGLYFASSSICGCYGTVAQRIYS